MNELETLVRDSRHAIPMYDKFAEGGTAENGTIHMLRQQFGEILSRHPGGFHWASTGDATMRTVHCSAGLPPGVPDAAGRIHYC